MNYLCNYCDNIIKVPHNQYISNTDIMFWGVVLFDFEDKKICKKCLDKLKDLDIDYQKEKEKTINDLQNKYLIKIKRVIK